jgi:hypothetical protein
MPDYDLPPLGDDTNEDTVMHDSQRTQTNAPYRDDSQRTRANAPYHGDTERMAGRKTKQQKPVRQTQQQVARRQPPPGYKARPARHPEQKGSLYLPWWSIALMLFAVLIISFAIVGAIYLLGNSGIGLPNPTPIIHIITAVPPESQQIVQSAAQAPSTQIISGQNPPSNLQLQGPTLEPIQFTPTPASIRIGSSVTVEGVDAETLNVRESTAINEQNVLFRALEGEVFIVIEGSAQGSGFTWWRIQDPDDPTRVGWAVSNYLSVMPTGE